MMEHSSTINRKTGNPMPWKKNIVLIAKNAYVWLAQLSKQYQQKITHLDQIPQEELEKLLSNIN